MSSGSGMLPDSMPQVSDDENTSQNATLSRIHGLRDYLAELQLQFGKAEVEGARSKEEVHRMYHQSVRGFAHILRPYLTDPELPKAKEYWESHEFGTMEIEPPTAIQKPDRGEMHQAFAGGDGQTIQRADPRNQVESRTFRVQGVKDFYLHDEPYVNVSWRVMFGPEISVGKLRSNIEDSNVRVHNRTHKNEPITVEKKQLLARGIIDDVATVLERFVKNIGMDVDYEPQPYEGEGGPGL